MTQFLKMTHHESRIKTEFERHLNFEFLMGDENTSQCLFPMVSYKNVLGRKCPPSEPFLASKTSFLGIHGR